MPGKVLDTQELDSESAQFRAVILLDRVAQRYGCLPSEVLLRADTLDIHVLNVSAAWENHQQAHSQSGKVPPLVPASRLQKMMQSVKQSNRSTGDNT